MMLPEKGGDFKNQEDLKTTIKQREIVINQGILMSNWINKYLNEPDAERDSLVKIKIPTARVV